MTGMRLADELPSVAGAYVLSIELPAPLDIVVRGRRHKLPAGRYVYCGSARGPGGIAARVRRHCRTDKTIRWHIDRLTTVVPVAGVDAYPDEDECALVERWMARGARPVVPGFGSSDCRTCPAHLLAVPLQAIAVG